MPPSGRGAIAKAPPTPQHADAVALVKRNAHKEARKALLTISHKAALRGAQRQDLRKYKRTSLTLGGIVEGGDALNKGPGGGIDICL